MDVPAENLLFYCIILHICDVCQMCTIFNQRVPCVQRWLNCVFKVGKSAADKRTGYCVFWGDVLWFRLFSTVAVVICTVSRYTSKGSRRRGGEAVKRSWRYGRGNKTHTCVEQSFYRNKVLLDISAEYGREVKDLFSVLGVGWKKDEMGDWQTESEWEKGIEW